MSKAKCIKLYDKIVTAFNEQSGGEYNDTMYHQVLGAREEMDEANEDDDWVYALKNLTECWIYVKHCATIDKMQNNMPNGIYC